MKISQKSVQNFVSYQRKANKQTLPITSLGEWSTEW